MAIFVAIAIAFTAVSYYQAKKAQKAAKKLADSMAGVLTTKDSTIESVPVIYGERRVGGTRVFLETDSGSEGKHEYLYMAIVLSEGEVESIDLNSIHFDDKPLAQYGLYAPVDETFTHYTQEDLGRLAAEGISVHDMNAAQSDVFQVEGFIGTDFQQASSILTAAPGWTNDHRLQGVAYLAIRLKWNEDVFSGVPSVSVIVKGKKVYDARKDSTSSYYNAALGVSTHRAGNVSTWEYSTNPALCLRDYLTNERYGKGLPDATINDDLFYAAADDIETFDVTPYSGSPSTIPLFQLNAVIDTSEEIFKNVENILMATRGFFPFSNGEYGLKIDQSTSSVLTIDSDMIIGGISVKGPQKEERFNIVEIKYPNKRLNYQPDTAIWPDPQSDVLTSFSDGQGGFLTEAELYTQFVSEDNGYELKDDIDLEFVTNYYIARDMARIFCLRSRYNMAVELQCTSEAIDLVVGDVVTVEHPTVGWTAGNGKLFQVDSVTLKDDGTVDLGLVEYTSSIYSYDPANEEVPYVDTELPDPFLISAPTNIGATSASSLLGDGTLLPRLSVTWTNAVDFFISHYEVGYKLTGSTEYSIVKSGGNSALIEGIKSGTYDVAVRSVNSMGIKSAWVEKATTVDVTEDTTAPSLPTSVTATGGVKSIELTWDNPSEADFKHVEIYVSETDSIPEAPTAKVDGESYILGGLTAGDDRYFWLKSVDFTGNKSDATTSVSGTAVAVAAGTDVDVDFSDVTGTTKPADNATKNEGALADKNTVGTNEIDDDSVTIDKIANTLQSTNYVAGTSGWKLTTDGTFEAGDGVFRGDIKATNLDLTGNATIAGEITATSVTANSITYAMLSSDAINRIHQDIALATNTSEGDSKTGSLAIPNSIVLTGFVHGSNEVSLTVSVSKTGYHYVSYTQAQRQATYTIQRKLSSDTVWSNVSGATGTIEFNQYNVGGGSYYHTINFSAEFTDNQAPETYDYRVTWSSVGTAYSVISFTAGFSANEAPAGVASDADTVDGFHAASFMRSDANTSTTGNLTVGGNLVVNGTTTTLNTATLDVEDKNITLNYGTGDTSGSANGAGITIQDAVSSGNDATILWDATNDEFDFSHKITAPNLSVSNWDAAYTYSQVGHLPASHDMTLTLSGDVSGSATFTNMGDATLSVAVGDADTLDTYHLSDITPYHSGSDFANGTLVITDIPASATSGASYVLEATGKSYSGNSPFNFMVQGYLYADTIISHSGVNYGGYSLDYIKVFNYPATNTLAFWWPRVSYWNSFSVHVRDAGGSSKNRVTSIVNSTEPSSTKKVQTNLFKNWHSGNDGSGSGLDADLLDGYNSDDFVKAYDSQLTDTDLSDTEFTSLDTGVYYANSNYSSNSNLPAMNYFTLLHLRNPYDKSTGAEPSSADRSADLFFGDTVGSIFWRPTQGTAQIHPWEKLWTSGNDGSDSGLDADLLDGQQGSYYAPASSLNNYLPLSGGTLTGQLLIDNGNILRLDRSGGNAHQRADARLDGTDQARLHWYGRSDSQVTRNFKHAWYDGSNYVNVTAEGGGVTFGGSLNPTSYQVSGTTVIDSSRNIISGNSIRTTNNSSGHSTITLGVRGGGSNATGRTAFIEGTSTTSNGEGNGRIMFTEHNSTTASADNYGVSFGYCGNVGTAFPSGVLPAKNSNGYWYLAGHNNNATGEPFLYGFRDGAKIFSNADLEITAGHSLTVGNSVVIDSSRNLTNIATISASNFFSTSNVNGTGVGGIGVAGGRIGFDQSGTRSWTVGAASGYLNVFSGDGNGDLNLASNIGLRLNGTTVINSSRNIVNHGGEISGTGFVSKYLSGTQLGNSYNERVVLLCPKVETNSSYYNIICGKLEALKTGGNVCDVFDVFVHSVYNDTRASFTSHGQRTTHKFVTCTYNGIKWVAIKFAFTANPYNYLRYTGTARTNFPNASADQLKVISYYDTNGGGVLNSEVYNSIADYNPDNTYTVFENGGTTFNSAVYSKLNIRSEYSGTNYAQLESNASGGVLKLTGGGTTLLRSYEKSEFHSLAIGTTTVIDSSRNGTFTGLSVGGGSYTTRFFSNTDDGRVLRLRDRSNNTGNIIQFEEYNGGNVWELVGRKEGTYPFYIYKNWGNNSGYKFTIDQNGHGSWYSGNFDVRTGNLRVGGTTNSVSGYQVNGTTVIDASRNVYPTVIDTGSGNAQGYKFEGRSFSWNSAMQYPNSYMPHIWQSTYGGWDPILGIKTSNGFWQLGAYSSDVIHFGYMAGAYGSHSVNGFDQQIQFHKDGSIVASGDITAYSDARLKSDIVTIPNALDTIAQLRGVKYTKDGKRSTGVIAQEVEAVMPEVVHTADDEMGTKSVAYGNMVGLLIEAIKEQQSEIDELKDLVKQLLEK